MKIQDQFIGQHMHTVIIINKFNGSLVAKTTERIKYQVSFVS